MKDRSPTFLSGLAIGCVCTLGVLYDNGASKPVTQETPQAQRPAATIMVARVTAYCPCSKCCGEWADGKTSRGRDARRTRGVAVNPKIIPYGSRVTIPGYGVFEADDTGGAMKKGDEVRIDLRFHTHQEALNFGVKTMEVSVVR